MTTPHTRAVARYNDKNYDQLKIHVPKGWKDTVKKAAENEKESLRQYIIKSVENRMSRP